MEDIKKELAANLDIDWSKIKEILSGIATTLESVAVGLPAGLIRNLILGVAGAINLIVSLLPDSQPAPDQKQEV